MPTFAEEVLVMITGKDQLSPVFNNARKNLTQLGQGGVSDINALGESFNKFGSNLTSINQGLTSMLSMLGFGTVLTESLENAGMRQTNKVYLGLKRGTEEAQRLYDKIQATVVALPGDDKFMTNILSMITATDKSIGETEIGDIGKVIANYTAAAKAKGQDAYETEKEIRNYILAGETRNLTNSVLANEIDLLKNKNTTMERVNALQKAMKKTGYDQLATIPTYVNMMEQLKGRLEKGFADLGDIFLPIVQGVVNLYNIIDDLTNSKLTVFILGTIGAFSLLTSIVTGTGFAIKLLIGTIGSSINIFINLINVINGVKSAGGVFKYLDSLIGGMAHALVTDQIIAETSARLGLSEVALNEIAIRNGITVSEIEGCEIEAVELDLKYAQILATTGLTEEKLNELLAIEGNTIATIYETYAIEEQITAKESYSIWSVITQSLEKSEIASRIANIGTKVTDTIVTWLSTKSKIVAATVNTYLTGTIMGVNTALIVGTATLILIPVAILAIVYAIYRLGESFGVWEWLSNTISRLWEAFANSKPIQSLIKYFQNFIFTLQTFFGSIFTIIGAVFGDMVGEGGDAVGVLINIFGTVGDVLMVIWDAFRVIWDILSLIIMITNPWLAIIMLIANHLNEIGQIIWWVMGQWNKFVDSAEYSAMVDAFKEVQSAFGEIWDEISQVFIELKSAFGDVWVAIFGESSSVIGENSNFILDCLKLIAGFITTVVVPIIKGVAFVIKLVVTPIILVIRFISLLVNAIALVIEILNPFNDSWNALDNIIGIVGNAFNWLGSIINDISNFVNLIVNEFTNIPNRIGNAILDILGPFGWLVEGVLNVLGIHSPGYIQEAVVNEFLGIPSRILGGIGNVVSAVGSFASAIWSGFDSVFGTDVSGTVDEFTDKVSNGFLRLANGDVSGGFGDIANGLWTPFDDFFGTDIGGQVDGFINRLSSSFKKLGEGDIIGAVKDFGDNFLNTLNGIFGTDVSGMVEGFFGQIHSNFDKLMSGDILGALKGTGNWFNDSIKRFTGIDLGQVFNDFHMGGLTGVLGFDHSALNNLLQQQGLTQNPQNFNTQQNLAQTYNHQSNTHSTIVNNNFGENSVPIDARNMTQDEAQKMFIGAFGFNKVKGVGGFL